jgi:hypothetical protein
MSIEVALLIEAQFQDPRFERAFISRTIVIFFKPLASGVKEILVRFVAWRDLLDDRVPTLRF